MLHNLRLTKTNTTRETSRKKCAVYLLSLQYTLHLTFEDVKVCCVHIDWVFSVDNTDFGFFLGETFEIEFFFFGLSLFYDISVQFNN